jgi:predicted nucleic acid-binding protein
MILLDTNILILGMVPDSEEARCLTRWLEEGVPLVTSTIV